MNLTIHRKGLYPDTFRQYKVYVNEKEVGTVGVRGTLTVENLYGEIKVVSKIDLCTSNEVIINADNNIQTYHLNVHNGNYLMNLFLPLTLATYFIMRRLGIHYGITDWLWNGFVFGGLLVLIYRITLGRNKYLTLKESDNNQ